LVKQRDADVFRFETAFIDSIEVVTGGTKLDPASDQDRAAAESWFQDVVAPGLSELEPIERIGILRRVPDAIGIIPENAICPLAGMALSGPPEQRVAAAGAIGGLIKKYRHARDCVPQPVQQIAWVVEALGPMQLPAADVMQAAEAVPLSAGNSDGGGENGSGSDVGGKDADGMGGGDVEVAMAPALAIPALVGEGALSGAVPALLGILSGIGIGSLTGDTPQEGTIGGNDKTPGGAQQNENGDPGETDPNNRSGKSGGTELDPSGKPQGPRPPEPPPPGKPGGGGRKPHDSSKGERHGDDGRALKKYRKQKEIFKDQLDRAATKKEKMKIKRRMRNIGNAAKRKKKGETHGKRSRR
jgi:hypothetical protein